MNEPIKFWDWEHGRWAYGYSVWDGRSSVTAPYATKGTLAGYVAADNYGNKQLVSVHEGRAVPLGADAGMFRSTWKAA